MERVATQFFSELDKLSDLSEVIVLGATNREDLLDPALIRAGRLDFVLPFRVPDEDERLEIFKVHTSEKPIHPDTDLAELARETEGMAGSDIAYICKRATMLAIAEKISRPKKAIQGSLSISATHFKTAISELRVKRGKATC
jgi:transitional endoplasmic reticulum ATPase